MIEAKIEHTQDGVDADGTIEVYGGIKMGCRLIQLRLLRPKQLVSEVTVTMTESQAREIIDGLQAALDDPDMPILDAPERKEGDYVS